MLRARLLSITSVAAIVATLAMVSTPVWAAQAAPAIARPVAVGDGTDRTNGTNTPNSPTRNSPTRNSPGGGVGIGSDFFASLDRPDAKPAPQDASLTTTAVWFVAKLALVLALAYCGMLGLKKFNGLKISPIAGGRGLRVAQQISLGPGRTLHIVDVGGRCLLLGSTASQVSLITELDRWELPPEPRDTGRAGFREQLTAFLGSPRENVQTAKSVAQMLRETATGIREQATRTGGARPPTTRGESAGRQQ